MAARESWVQDGDDLNKGVGVNVDQRIPVPNSRFTVRAMGSGGAMHVNRAAGSISGAAWRKSRLVGPQLPNQGIG